MKSKTAKADVKEGDHEAIEPMHTHFASAPSWGEIRKRAYELHLERGCVHGLDQDDWLQAERELMDKYQAR
jgi:hypothetical protein